MLFKLTLLFPIFLRSACKCPGRSSVTDSKIHYTKYVNNIFRYLKFSTRFFEKHFYAAFLQHHNYW